MQDTKKLYYFLPFNLILEVVLLSINAYKFIVHFCPLYRIFKENIFKKKREKKKIPFFYWLSSLFNQEKIILF